MLRVLCLLTLAILLAPSLSFSATSKPWKAGVAKIAITPRQSLWMAGYGARTKASEGTAQGLYAKALALEDQTGKRAVLVTTDMLGFPATLSRRIAERVQKQYNLPRDRLLLSSSHTHSGPVVERTLAIAYCDMTPQQWAAVDTYTRELEDKIVRVIGDAIKDLSPARLSFGRSEVGFATNRRNEGGPVDYDVPVLRVEGQRGKLRAVVFGYACHNVTLGSDFYQYHGDYAGVAQERLETRYPGALALFVAGCGGDINPNPRLTIDITRQHGEALALAVGKAIGGSMQTVGGPLKAAWKEFPVAFATPPTREELQERLASDDKYVRRHAEEMLRILKRDGHLATEYPYPLQVWQFGPDLTLVAMAGEVVVDYALRLKKELGPRPIWVAGYCNDVFAYIPSLRVLQEGGYEGGGAMIYYGQPGPFAPSVEETIVGKVHELVKEVQSK